LSKSQQQINVVPVPDTLPLSATTPSVSSAANTLDGGVSSVIKNIKHPVSLELMCRTDAATRAEIVWALKVVTSNYSFRSCDITSVFKVMFPNVEVIEKMTMGKTKTRYFITHAIGPYFYQILIEDVTTGGLYYTLLYDETCNTENKKELQIDIRYWSTTQNKVIVSHLQTFFLGCAEAKVLKDSVLLAVNKANCHWRDY